jgi:membrane fusion protein, multidrug efflux system
MLWLFLIFYVLPIYLVFFHYKLLPLNGFWTTMILLPPILGGIFLWVTFARFTPMPQDAYVQAPVVQVAAQVSGPVVKVYVKDDQTVKQGDPLFEIDSSLYRYGFLQAQAAWVAAQENVAGLLASLASADAVVEQAEATLAAARQNVVGAKANIEAAIAAVDKAKSQVNLAEIDLKRYSSIVGVGAVTQQQVDTAARNLDAAKATLQQSQQAEIGARAALSAAESQVLAAQAAVAQACSERRKVEVQLDPLGTARAAIEHPSKSTDKLLLAKLAGPILEKAKTIDAIVKGQHPTVIQAEQVMDQARYNLDRTVITAPCDGVLSQVQVTVGTMVGAGKPVMTLTDTTRWELQIAVAENSLGLVRPGDTLYYSLRNYPGKVRKGEVGLIGRGVVHGQGVPGGTLPDPDQRRIRTTNTPDAQSDFFVTVPLADDQPNRPLRVGATGRVTILAGGGLAGVTQLALLLHYIFSFGDFLYPKPSLLVLLILIGIIVGFVYLIHRVAPKKAPAKP